jgi:hypothetical protein
MTEIPAVKYRANLCNRFVGTMSMLERSERIPSRAAIDVLARALELAAEDRALLQAAAGESDPARPQSHGLRPIPQLAGRAAEVELLERHLGGNAPPVLMLAGEPGIGKTRLLEEVAQRAERRGWAVLFGECRRYSGGEDSYAPILDALERRLQGHRRGAVRTLLRGCAWLARLLPDLAHEGIDLCWPKSTSVLPPYAVHANTLHVLPAVFLAPVWLTWDAGVRHWCPQPP